MSYLVEAWRDVSARKIKWDTIRNFNIPEWRGDLQTTSALLVYALDEYRHNLGFPVWISPRNWGTHNPGSYHYPSQKTRFRCWAVDVFPDCDLVWAYHIAMRSKLFAGVGVYPFWEYSIKKKTIIGGLHLDIRFFKTNKRVWFYDGPADKGKYRSVHTAQDLRDMEVLVLSTEDRTAVQKEKEDCV